jgi:hypothetical protein
MDGRDARKDRRTNYTALPSCQRFFRGPDTFWTRAKGILVHVHVPRRGEVRAEECGLP